MNDALLQSAIRLHQMGRVAEAERLCNEILDTQPAQCDALYLLGVMHFQRGAYDKALDCYERALAVQPGLAHVLAARGAAQSMLGRHAEALQSYGDAVALDPRLATAWNHRGNALLELGRPREAMASYDRALSLKPDYAEAWRHRGMAALSLGRDEDALASFERVLAIEPRDAPVIEECGNILGHLGRHAESVAAYGRALALRPGDAHLLYKHANGLSILRRYDEAIRDCETVLSIDPDYPYARGVLIHSKMQCCDWDGFESQRAKISAAVADGKRAVSPFNHKVLSDSPAEQLQCARVWVAHECPAEATRFWRGTPYRHERIRLAYVSADFNMTAMASLMAGVFERHDRRRFETIAISFGSDAQTPMRARLESAFERFIDVRAKAAAEIASLMRDMEIDIAVDLMGFTGDCRSRLFAYRPVPVQVNYLGFPGTMGAAYMDYILADRIVIPERSTAYYRENVVYLPHSYQGNDVARPLAERVPTRAEVGLPETGFVFCCFNNNYKIGPDIFSVWMRLLCEIDESVLWLLEDNPFVVQNLKREARSRGVDPSRLVFAPRIGPPEHLARHRLADLFLDTLPYNAHTTASDALWMGLPIVTCAGESFAARVAASVLNAAGLPELVTGSLDEYERLARRLASDRDALAAIREKIARGRYSCPLFDAARFARNLESAYLEMWRRSQNGEPPGSFAVEDAS